MVGSQDYVDAYLEEWSDIQDEFADSGLLIGNGASCAVWDKFKYPSLYEKAQSDHIEHQLSLEDIKIFEAMDTLDFERVLSDLWTTKIVCKALQQDFQSVHERYVSIQKALVEAIHDVHLPWLSASEEVLRKIRDAVLPHQSIYTTNYDLLLYWSIMTENTPRFKDYFWSNPGYFDIKDTKIFGEGKRILYLHGALHLVSLPFGLGTRKLTADRRSLLDQFGQSLRKGETPLIVTEGKASDKLASIRKSDYLSFAYEQFANHESDLVIFGHSLGKSDYHLIHAIQQWGNRNIAISLRRGRARNVIARKAKLQELLPQAQIHFFDAETHPLGNPDLKIM